MTADAAPADLSAREPESATHVTGTPMHEVLRDITRGGLAGLIVGVALAGIGGRLVMRLAALIVPESVGSVTENGNVIGTITVGGTATLVLLVGLLFGAIAGSLWVVMSPWLPTSAAAKTAVTIPIAVALGLSGLVDDRNRDFVILGNHPLVIASLIALVALFGPGLVVAERWLDRRLPHPGPGDARIVAGFVLVTGIGSLLTVFVVVPLFLGSALFVSGLALVVVGLCTVATWWFRIGRPEARPAQLTLIARLALSVATVAGLVVAVPEVLGALGAG